MPELLDDEDVPSTLPSLLEQNLDTAPKGDEFKLVSCQENFLWSFLIKIKISQIKESVIMVFILIL